MPTPQVQTTRRRALLVGQPIRFLSITSIDWIIPNLQQGLDDNYAT